MLQFLIRSECFMFSHFIDWFGEEYSEMPSDVSGEDTLWDIDWSSPSNFSEKKDICQGCSVSLLSNVGRVDGS